MTTPGKTPLADCVGTPPNASLGGEMEILVSGVSSPRSEAVSSPSSEASLGEVPRRGGGGPR